MYDKLFPATHHFYPLQQFTPEEPGYLELERVLARSKTGRTDNMIYVHLPYCERRCLFCPFHVRANKGDDETYSNYIDAVIAEMGLLTDRPYVRDMDFAAVYLGGGSPSLFPLRHLERLFSALRSHFRIRPNAEWTFEGEPKSLNDDALMAWLVAEGVRRISYGIQTFDTGLRERLNIEASVDDVIATLERARKYGIGEVNVDMIYLLPGHDMDDLQRDLDELSRHCFDSVDYYYLSYSAFPKKTLDSMAKGTFPARPPEAVRPRMDRHIRKALADLGYHHVTDHVFSRRPRSSEYYRILWAGGYGEWRAETLALGSSARGYLDGVSYSSLSDPAAYIASVADSRIPLQKVSRRLARPENRGLVFFPKFFRLPKEAARLTESERALFGRLEGSGYLVDDGDAYRLTEDGKDWIPNITMDLFEEEQRAVALEWVAKLNSNYRNLVSQ